MSGASREDRQTRHAEAEFVHCTREKGTDNDTRIFDGRVSVIPPLVVAPACQLFVVRVDRCARRAIEKETADHRAR